MLSRGERADRWPYPLKFEDLQGGTNRPGVPDAVFAMPPGHAMRYDLPASSLSDFVSAYATYGTQDRSEVVNWFLPAPPMICVLLDAGAVNISIRNHRFDPGPVSLYGATSTAFSATTRGGVQVGIGLTALGWVRLFTKSAQKFTNCVIPLSEILPPGISRQLSAELRAISDPLLIAPTLDAMLAPLLVQTHPHENVIKGFTDLMLVDGVIEITDAAGRLDISEATLRRVAMYAFGMPPKVLLRRARFLRSFMKLLRSGEWTRYGLIDSSYFDQSHFIRDANAFLGTTPRRFMARETTFLAASLRARAAAIGPAIHALHGNPR